MAKIRQVYIITCDECGAEFHQDSSGGGRPRSLCYECGPRKRDPRAAHRARVRRPDESSSSFVISRDRELRLRVQVGDSVRSVPLGTYDTLGDAVAAAKLLRDEIERADIASMEPIPTT